MGEKDRGWYQIASQLDYERSGIERLMSNYPHPGAITRYVQETGQIRRELVRHRLAQLHIEFTMGRFLVYKVAWLLTQGLSPTPSPRLRKPTAPNSSSVSPRLPVNSWAVTGSCSQAPTGRACMAVSRGLSLRASLYHPGRDLDHSAQYHRDTWFRITARLAHYRATMGAHHPFALYPAQGWTKTSPAPQVCS